MLIIAFKRAGKSNGALHPEFITEWINAAFLPSLEGYESMLQEHFDLEFAKNDERHAAHLQHLKEQEELAHKAAAHAELADTVKEKELTREFEIYKRWKRNKGK